MSVSAPAALANPTQAATTRPQSRALVIGYGNPGREDDGLGPAAAQAIARLGWPQVSTIDNYQLAIEDAIDIAEHDGVWFVDAACTGDTPCAIRPLSPRLDISFTSHLLKPETVLAIAAQQFGKRPKAHLVSIRGYDFDFRECLSPCAASNLTIAVSLLRRRIGRFLGRAS